MKTLPLKPKQGAFTLIELLVTIGIILVLAGLGFPALKTATDRGKQAACLGHAKQLSLAYLAYRNDNSGDINGLGAGADGSNWMTRMNPYFETPTFASIRLKYMCPAHPQFLQDSASHIGWAFNSNLDVTATTPFHRYSQVSNPARVIYAIEGFREYNWSAGDGQNPNYTVPTAWLKADKSLPAGQEVIFPHKGAANAVFLDGHIQALKPPLARETWAIDGV